MDKKHDKFDNFKYHVSCTDGKISVRSQETEEITRPVEKVALTTKGLQERKQLVSGTMVEK